MLVYLVSEDWYFLSHRLPMASAAQRAGYEVHVATRVNKGAAAITAHGFGLHPLRWRRGSTDPRQVARLIRDVRALYRGLAPDIVHHVALEACVFGGCAARLAGLHRVVAAVTGLGFVFTDTSPRARAVRLAVNASFRAFVDRSGTVILLQNVSDRALLTERGLMRRAKPAMIAGSGIDTQFHEPLPEPPARVPTIGVATRMLAIKGVATLVEASRLLTKRGVEHRLLLAGHTDAENPSAIPESTLRRWSTEPGIEWLGHVDDVRKLWAEAHIACLTSAGGEGLPKSLLEAAACGRPIVATDVPGCREIARASVNALLVPPNDPHALADALQSLIGDAELRRRFGQSGRQIVEQEFSADRIGREIVALYDRMLE